MNKAVFHFAGRSAALLAVPITFLSVHLCAVQAEEWPQYRGPQANGVTTEKIQTAWPSGGPRSVWRVPTSAGFSAFAVSGGKAYTLVSRDLEGVKNEVCIALDAESGREVWAAPVGFSKYDGGGNSGAPGNDGGDGPRSTPAVDGNRVYVLSAALVLSCLNAESGAVVWKKDLVKEHGARNITWQNAASPVIDGNLVFVCAGGAGQSLLCFHKSSGGLVWKGESDKMTHATPVVANILGHRQVIFLTQSGLVSVVPGTGKVLWRYTFPYRTSTAASPVVGDDMVFCSAGYTVGAAAVRVSRSGDL
jgi:outer membrane protein assembly factor BamB